MTEKTYASYTLGLESTSKGIKAAVLSSKRGSPQIDQLEAFPLDSTNGTPHLKGLDLSGKTLIVTSIGADEILARPLEVKLKKESDIEAVLMFQAEPMLPYPIENTLLDKVILSSGDDGSQLTLLAIKKEHLQRHLDHWKEFNIEPEVVSTVPIALTAFSNFVLATKPPAYFVLHLGEEQTCCIYVKEGHLTASKATTFSLNSIRQIFRQERGLNDDNASIQEFNEFNWNNPRIAELIPATYQKLKDFSIEIGKVIFSLMKQTKELSLPPLLTTGEGTVNESLCTFLLKEFNGQILDLNPPSPPFSEADLKTYALPIGEALTALPNYTDQINFLQGEFAFPRPWRRLSWPLTVYFLLSLGLATAFYLFGQAYIANKENHLRHQYAQLLTTMQKPYTAFEEELAAKLPPEEMGETPPSVRQLDSLTPSDIDLRMGILEKELQAVPNLFPLDPNIPKVTDLLAWLSTHPNIVGKDGKTPLITLVGLNYSVIKRPDLKSRADKYQVKVELDFTSSSATAAREFHDALLAANNFVDPKTEIKWTTQKGRYKAIFMLKDKTNYP